MVSRSTLGHKIPAVGMYWARFRGAQCASQTDGQYALGTGYVEDIGIAKTGGRYGLGRSFTQHTVPAKTGGQH